MQPIFSSMAVKPLVLMLGAILLATQASAETVYRTYRVNSENEPSKKVSIEEEIILEVEIEEEEDNDEDEDEIFLTFDLVASARIGMDHSAVGDNQHVRISSIDTAPNDFILTNPWETQMVWGGFLGIELPILESPIYRWQTGAAYYNTNPFKPEGIATSVGDPASAELNFEYSVHNQRIMWENKLLAKLNNYFSLYLLGGIGAAINNAYDFEETSRDPRNDVDPFFGDNSTTSFSYAAGLGIEVSVWENIRASLGYQFSDLGKVELGDIDTTRFYR